MTLDEALEMLECISNLDDSARLSYMCKHHTKIKDAAMIGANAIRSYQKLDKILKCWEVIE